MNELYIRYVLWLRDNNIAHNDQTINQWWNELTNNIGTSKLSENAMIKNQPIDYQI